MHGRNYRLVTCIVNMNVITSVDIDFYTTRRMCDFQGFFYSRSYLQSCANSITEALCKKVLSVLLGMAIQLFEITRLLIGVIILLTAGWWLGLVLIP